jgi:hypothetical protein
MMDMLPIDIFTQVIYSLGDMALLVAVLLMAIKRPCTPTYVMLFAGLIGLIASWINSSLWFMESYITILYSITDLLYTPLYWIILLGWLTVLITFYVGLDRIIREDQS